ncbi:protein phosphatase 2C domain-containing protein [Pseudonocardia kujensis]|uniref:protein phosphatase 2C domain-containing protein n=1 Tax=Pseudonocardia kujensis TaxID=1128675 RepID=UPI001E63B27C|nr:protein phosphatase 2C domain-containing protein [Pseudonocardia kujensis]MCE0768113.1 protein phosphatase 2C domain-containing protein [Pseudonocardia kujensis]
MGLTVRAASLPGGTPPGQDRWGTSERAAVVLDGASSHSLEAPAADAYVDQLLAELLARIDDGDHRDVLRGAITETAAPLGLSPGRSPSSTVLMLRVGEQEIEVAALGDSTAVIGHPDGTTTRLTDDRLQDVSADLRQAYRDELRRGSGFGDEHRARLRELQRSEIPRRNRPGGYWISEAEPTAADELVIRAFPRSAVAWVVLATDGAQKHVDRLGGQWPEIADQDDEQLAAFLRAAQQWETHSDPEGTKLPRSKRHDDKTLLTWRPE